MHTRHAQGRKVGFRAKMQANSSIMRIIQAKIVLLLFGFVPLLAKVLTFAIFIRIFAAKLTKDIMKIDLQLVAAFILSIGGLILLFCGVFIDPQGEIHTSLLVAFGETCTFAGALFGIDYIYKTKR